MAERRGASIEAIAEPRRAEFAAQYAGCLQQLLEREFPAATGHEHRLEWAAAGCVDARKHSQEIQRRCQAARIKVTKGRDWGIAVTAGPADITCKNFKVIVAGAVPFVEGVQGWIMRVAAVVAGVVGVGSFAVGLWQEPHAPRTAFLTGAIFGAAVFLALTFAGLVLLSPVRMILSSYRMRQAIASCVGLAGQGWTQMGQAFPGMPPLARKRSPAFFYFCRLIAISAAGGLCYWASQRPQVPSGASIALILVVVVAGFAALYMLLGLIVSLFGFMKE